MTKIYLALYKGYGGNCWQYFEDWLIRKTTSGQYSHCELVVAHPIFTSGHHYENEIIYNCYTSSPRDGGVRCKQINICDGKWDLIELKNISPEQIKHYFDQTKGQTYDWWGAIGCVIGIKQKRSKYFCSEWCFNALTQSEDGWRFSPNELSAIARNSLLGCGKLDITNK